MIFKKKRKHFMITLVYNGKEDKMQVSAYDKNDAIRMVTDVVLNCSLFNFKSKDDFEIYCKKMKK